MARKSTFLDLADIVAKGENPKGYVGQTANGSTRAPGPGWNWRPKYEKEEAPAEGPWGNDANRTGE
jgi:hypothetical protein